ncbi:HGGxSTG domain-containing protein [Armatimonas sp.]|uniref:HGGxSTG domain-containing protein n=1 Tax=Armatimonas sp. TaxID=1872638 RepID=UPI003753A3D8
MQNVKELLKEMEAHTEAQRQLSAPLIAEALREARAKEQEARELRTMPKKVRPLCGAKTRAGSPCQARALLGSERCRLHGGREFTLAPAYRQHLQEEAKHLRVLVKVCRALLGRVRQK